MVETPFTDGSSPSNGGGGESDTDDNDSAPSPSDSARRGRRRARDTIQEIDDENRDNTDPGSENGNNSGTQRPTGGPGGPTQGPGLDGGSSDGNDADVVPAPDPSDPSTAPSATPAPSAGDDAGASTPSDGTDVEAPVPDDPSTAPSATPAPSAGEDAGETVVSTPDRETEPPVETTDPASDADTEMAEARDAVEGYPTRVPDIAAPSESGTAAAADIINSADIDPDVAGPATSGGFSSLPLPTVNLDEPAANFRNLVETRNTGFTTVNADLPGTGTVPIGFRLDMSEEDSADTAADQFTEGAVQAFNPAAALMDVENIAEAADNPGTYLRNPAASIETGTAAGRDATKNLVTAARENPAGTAGALTVGLAGVGVGAATAARGSGSLRAALKAEVDPRVGPFGTTLETKAFRGARNRINDLPFPGNERGSLQLGKFRTRGSDADSDVDTDADSSVDADSDDLGVPDDDPFRVSDKRLFDPARDFDRDADTNPNVDPTDRSGVAEDDIQSGIAGQGNPQAAPGTTFEWDTSDSNLVDTEADVDVSGPPGTGSTALFGVSALSEAGQPQVDADGALDIDDNGLLTSADPDTDSATAQDATLQIDDDITGLTGTTTTTDLDVGPDDATSPGTETDTLPDVTDNTESDVFTDPGTDQPVGQDTPQDTRQDTPEQVDTPQDVPGDPPNRDPPRTDTPGFDPGRDTPFDRDRNPPEDRPNEFPDLPGDDGDDRKRRDRDDEFYSDLFSNPTISPDEAVDFDPFED